MTTPRRLFGIGAAILGVLSFGKLHAEETRDTRQTNDFCNGRWWDGQSDSSKLVFIRGLYEGMENAFFFALAVEKNSTEKQKSFTDYEYSYVRSTVGVAKVQLEIDSFYRSDAANKDFPVVRVYKIAVAKLSGGWSPEEIKALTDDYRKSNN